MARPIIRAAIAKTLAKKVLVSKFSIPDITAADFDNAVEYDLLSGSEALDDTIESTGGTTAGTNVAQVPIYSKLTSLRLHTFFQGQGGEQIRWMLCKNEVNNYSAQNFMDNFHNSDSNPTARDIRANILAKGITVVNNDRLTAPLSIFVKRKTLSRLSSFKENDKIQMVFAKDATNTTCTVTQWGNMYIRANG